MKRPFIAMDTNFFTELGWYTFESRAEMLAELGYDGMTFTIFETGYKPLWRQQAFDDIEKIAAIQKKTGIGVDSIYMNLDLSKSPAEGDNADIPRILSQMTSETCANLELSVCFTDNSVAKSDASADGKLLQWLEPIIPVLEKNNLHLHLYPHSGFWIERVEDSVRLKKKINHPRIHAVFCGLHWFCVDGQDIEGKLREAAPHLGSANISGMRVTGEHKQIVPLDDGQLDNSLIIGLLDKYGYKGKIALQGFGCAGDVYTHLKKSINTFRDIDTRVQNHPSWSQRFPA